MPNIKYVKESPNNKVATFVVDMDMMGDLGKIAIAQGSKLVPYSPLAAQLYSRGSDLTRIDFFHRPGEGTGISLSRKLIEWEPAKIANVQRELAEFFARPQPAIMIEALKSAVQPQQPFNAGNNPVKGVIQKSFIQQVNPILGVDGGAMELMNVELKPNGEIYADVIMIGSCNGCASAKDGTLKGATGKINDVLEVVKQRNPGNAGVQALNFRDIRILETSELVLFRS